MIMRFRPANIRLINRRSKLPRLLLALSSGKDKGNDNDKNNPTVRGVDTVTPYQANALIERTSCGEDEIDNEKCASRHWSDNVWSM
jgi:hypothetical protein